MQSKTTMIFHLTPVNMDKIKEIKTINADGVPGALLVGVLTRADTMEINVKLPQILEKDLLYESAVPLLDISPRTLPLTTNTQVYQCS